MNKYKIVTRSVYVYEVLYTLADGSQITATVSDVFVDAKNDALEEFKSAYVVSHILTNSAKSIKDKNGVTHIITNNPVKDRVFRLIGTKEVKVRSLVPSPPTIWERIKGFFNL